MLVSHPLAFLLSSLYRVFVGLSKSRLKASWADIIRKQGGSSCVYRIKVEAVEGHGKVSGRHTLPSPPLRLCCGATELQWARDSQGEVGGTYKMQISRPHPPIQCLWEGLRGAHF